MRNIIKQSLAAGLIAGAIVIPFCAQAAVTGEEQITGRITALIGKYDMHVRTPSGEIDDVMLHQGTIINPTGLQLQNGMRVTILGNPAGNTFDANEIDTPYHVSYAEPYPVPFYGGFGFGYGPFFGGPFGFF